MKRAAILSASGIGDGLLMMIGAHHLKMKGYAPTIFHDSAKILSSLFEDDTFAPHIPLNNLEKELENFDLVLVENDNSERAWHLFDLRKKGRLSHVTFFFPTPSKNKQENDFLFDQKKPVASNLALGCQHLLGTPLSKENNLSIPKGKTYRKYPKRIIIHPTSKDPKRNWPKEKFLKLAKRLRQEGYDPTFCVASHEQKEWEEIDLPKFVSLKEIAAYTYESGYLIGNDSGLGHLASNLKIPTVTISGNPKRVRLWRPDWTLGKVVTLPLPLPNFKGIHLALRDNYWQHFISTHAVYKTFKELEGESSRHLF